MRNYEKNLPQMYIKYNAWRKQNRHWKTFPNDEITGAIYTTQRSVKFSFIIQYSLESSM